LPASGFFSSWGNGFIAAAASVASFRASSSALPEQVHRAVKRRRAGHVRVLVNHCSCGEHGVGFREMADAVFGHAETIWYQDSLEFIAIRWSGRQP
jgi:hypothetical protein